eukprot:gene2934-3512_t
MPPRHLLAGALAAATATAPAPLGTNFTAHRLFDAATGPRYAKCLDGSPPLFYHAPGWGDGAHRWQAARGVRTAPIASPGGGTGARYPTLTPSHQTTRPAPVPAAAPARAAPAALCLVCYVPLPTAPAGEGYMNRSSPTNSMADWNYVFIRYCGPCPPHDVRCPQPLCRRLDNYLSPVM